MRHRDLLHISKLDDFCAFCESQGWEKKDTKDIWEVLRMYHPILFEWLVVHRKAGATEHYTTWGNSAKLTRQFLTDKRGK